MIFKIAKLSTFLCLICLNIAQAGNEVKPGSGLDQLAGTYWLAETHKVTIEQEDGEWVLQIDENDKKIIKPTGINEGHVPELGISIQGAGENELVIKRYGLTVKISDDKRSVNGYGNKPIPDVIDELMPRLMIARNVPGTSVALIQNGDVSYLKQFGLKTAGQEPPVTENTIFEAASMSKPVFAYVVLQLVEEGLLNLDTPLVEYLGKPYIENDERHERITARMVLSHTSGFPNWRKGGWRKGGPVPILFEPGTSFRYSGEGFLFLQKVVEKLTNTPLDELMKERLLKPLGMNHSSYVWQDRYDAFAAGGHYKNGLPKKNRSIYHTPNAAFTLYTTPADYAKFLIEMMKDDRSAGHSLNSDSITQMLSIQSDAEGRTPIVRRSGETEGTVHFGLGWKIEAIPSGHRINHTGSNGTGFRCLSEFNPRTKNGIVILTNGIGGAQLRNELMRYAGEE